MNKEKGKPTTAILHYTAPPIVGGVEAVIQAHCGVFKKYNFPVAVIAGQGEGGALAEGTTFHRVPEMSTKHKEVVEISRILESGDIPVSFESFTNRLYTALEEIVVHYDNLIVHNVFFKHFNIPLTAALLKLIEDGKIQNCIGWCHDITWTSPNSRSKVHEGYPWDLLRKYNPKIIYVTVSQEQQKSLASLYNLPKEKIKVIYNGVEPQMLLGLSKEGIALMNRLSIFDSELILLMPVRVTKAKNIEFAFDLLVELKSLGIQPKLILTGPPDPHSDTIMDYYQNLQKRRQELDLVNEMYFIYESGPQRDEPYEIDMNLVGEFYRVSDLVFMPSHREGFGMPVLEAGLVGLPAICSASVPAAVEIGGDDVIILNEEKDPAQLAKEIVEWMQTNSQFHFRQLIRNKYTWMAIFNQEIIQLLKNPA